ncbi:tetratricopeptide repeat protein [Chitinophaga arvensicola]|uniref:Tetratricopeptide repeat-containing protein n=1 Tax=Chitinophaga arvensicola TaxID=29529 RepID=A0A1I0S4J5_9BACT|nr:tetratricopeptide repeat protein [Chitinophaga arvensicola]SEW49717.1 Tetratricopeptide repeat-containing protein [Chitinophaga arvensicola]
MNKTRFHDYGTQAVLLRKKRMLVIKVISILFPFLIIAGVEGGLRLFNYGHDLRLFITSPQDPDYYQFNPDASLKYFSDPAVATKGNVELFKKVKDTGTLRIFVLGESTTIGYPYFHNGSFHRWLQYRLMHTNPDKRLEIINLSLTGVNSYTVEGFAKELLPYQPDAVLIYTGHNEYYGCLGAGSTDKIAGSPFLIHLVLKLREYRLTQLMANALNSITSRKASAGSGAGKTRMEMMVAEQQIPFGSPLYERGITQFTTNMDNTLRLLHEANVPVFISNLVSAEKDLFPFISVEADSTKYPDFNRNYQLGVQSISKGDSTAAFQYFETAQHSYNTHAGCNYYLGELQLQRGDSVAAKNYFDKARDFDALRFRAPSKLNEVLPQLVSKYKNAHLVDANAVFEANSPGRIIGKELVLEHVHPDLKGYALLSDIFYQSLKTQGIFTVSEDAEMSFAQLQQMMPLTVVDTLAAKFKIANLKKSWPFNHTGAADTMLITTAEEQLAYDVAFRHTSWGDAMRELYTTYNRQGDLAKAAIVVAAIVQEHPLDMAPYEEAGNYYGKLNNTPEAIFYFKRVFASAPSFDVARTLFVLCLKADKTTEALPYLNYAIDHNERRLNLLPVRECLLQIVQLQQVAAKEPANIAVLNQIAGLYIKMGNKDGAELYIAKVLQTSPGNPEALAIQDQLKKV